MNSVKIRKEFPFLRRDLIYFDNASSAQKPQVVLDAMMQFYTDDYANVHRGVYARAERSTELYESARASVASFIGSRTDEIVFTRGTTDAINAVAGSWGHAHIGQGDEIIITELEHHSNFVPWQQLALQVGATLKIMQVNQDGTLDMQSLDRLISKHTKLIAVTHTSNALGTHVDVAPFVKAARSVGARVLLDAAQSVAHELIDMKTLGVDFLAFSGHKLYGPTGIGVLYIKKELHDQMPPYQYGGGMVFRVSPAHTDFARMPQRLEAGTPPIAQAIGLEAAITYFKKTVSYEQLQAHETALCARVIEGLSPSKKISLLGPVDQLQHSGHMISFIVDGLHAHDVAAFLSDKNIAVRAGHHCAQPLALKLGVQSMVRVSFGMYNTMQEVDRFILAMGNL